jgi:hypothetical protein
MLCATRIVSAVSRNENLWPSENTMEKQHPNKRKQHSEPGTRHQSPRRDLALRYTMGSVPSPCRSASARPGARASAILVSQQAAPLPPPSEVRSGRVRPRFPPNRSRARRSC